jgi:hypothetical protein
MINLILPTDGYSLEDLKVLKLRNFARKNSNRMFYAFRMSLP